MFAAQRTLAAAPLPFAGGEHALALFLLPWFLCFPQVAASEVYATWSRVDVRAMQIVYAPLRWPACVQFVRSCFGSDLAHDECTIKGVRIVVISHRDAPSANVVAPPARPTVLFVPGGAFIADFEAVDLFFLYHWVRETRATVVYTTYEFAPQAPYPVAMTQVAEVYRALRVGSSDAALGFHASPLVVAGLSAGGNLAVSSLLSILSPQLLSRSHERTGSPATSARQGGGGGTEQVTATVPAPMPDALLLICPVLNLNRSPSPSRVAFCSDTLLPQPLLSAFAKAYDGGGDSAMWDPLLSPALAPDEALRRLPLTHIQVGGFDPLLDDSVDFNTRIRRLGVPGELRIHRTLPHTFLSFPHWHVSPEVQHAMATSVTWLDEVLHSSSVEPLDPRPPP
jgi:acetyl esterase/lipase